MKYVCCVCGIEWEKPGTSDGVSHGYCKPCVAIEKEKIMAMMDETVADVDKMTIESACRIVLKECKNEYAKTYARAMGQAMREYGEQGAKVQALYLLGNISHWRGGRSKEVRAFLKEYTKGM